MPDVMVVLVALSFPVLLMLLMLVMDRVEQSLRQQAVGAQVVTFLDTARPEEVETFVSQGYAQALDRYWRRRAFTARLPVPTVPVPSVPVPSVQNPSVPNMEPATRP